MFRRLIFPKEVTDQEARRLAHPAALAIIVLCGLLILSGWEIVRTKGNHGSPVTLANAVAISIGVLYLPPALDIIPHIMLVFVAAIMIIIWGRASAYTFLFVALVLHIGVTDWNIEPLMTGISDFSFFLLAGIVIETTQRLGNTNMNRIKRH